MTTLPADLADPLHLREPSSWSTWMLALLAALAVLALLAWLYRRRRRRRPATQPPKRRAAPPAKSRSDHGIAGAIAALHHRYATSLDYRRGCHELAGLLRRHFEDLAGGSLASLTAREIAARIAKPTVGSLFELLEELQFRRREPERREFDAVCELAAETAKSRAVRSRATKSKPAKRRR